MPDRPFRITVVGGGTAGWLSALILREGGKRAGLTLDLSVIESTKVPTIGVGEGTTAVFREMLRVLALDEMEFLRATGATIKFGIRHKDWRHKGHHYDGPIDDPHRVAGGPAGNWLDRYCIASGKSVTEPHLFAQLMRRNRSPYARKTDGTLIPLGPFHHAFHFDQAKVGQWLRSKAGGIEHIDALVEGAERNPETGHIRALILEDGARHEADFFVDCTGFRRALIETEMGASWVGYGDRLPVNRAMPFWIDHQDGAEIAPYTLAWAQDAGWMWQIPTTERIGCGYVYSDAFLTPDEARAEIEARLGHPIEPRNDIPINAGRLDRAWIGNCVAAGLAQSFFEPLEATSIHGTIVQMMLFAQRHLPEVASGQFEPEAYNADVARQGDDFCTFINMHYVSERRDTPFWRHVAETCISDEVRDLLDKWRGKTPSRGDFAPFPAGLPHVEEQLYVPVLDGLGLTRREAAKQEMSGDPRLRAHARKVTENLRSEYRRAAAQAIGHRAFLDAL
ncbi:tryptophan halogenase family protein [Alexandriicola marinus]|uniref:tryptophan halogenase family protein n=1 Tax=Alexandriicola marinus TaxID=2081710 RepID=UPI000FDA5F32|nr:tryptophan halogenase family protein [Alexandriicola marinus]